MRSTALRVLPPRSRRRCSHRSRRKRTERDPSCLATFLMRFHHDLNITVEAGEKAHQPVDGIFSETPPEHPRHLGLGYAHELTNLNLGELAFVGNPIDFRDDLSFQEMSISIWQAEIGKNVAASHLHFDPAHHHFLSFLKR